MNGVSADFEHEIPNGSKLYFGKNAELKRKIENFASEIFVRENFSEILTPHFSYHQRLSVKPRHLLKISDPINKEISLRADSTVDVVRIVRRRLKDENLTRLFYIQPIFKYPSVELYQIGAELINETDLNLCIKLSGEIFAKFGLNPSLQISNLEIVKTVCELLEMDIEIFENGKFDKIFDKNIAWLNRLMGLSEISEIKNVKSLVPNELKIPLEELENLALSAGKFSVRLLPLYYSKMRYYDKLFFRFFSGNSILCSGGDYRIDGVDACGFAILTDAMIEKIADKE